MILKEAFLYIMVNLSQQHKKDDAFSKVISECFDNIVHINDNNNLDMVLKLAKETFDPDELIKWFEFDHTSLDLFCGGETITVDTPEKLYNYMEKEYSYTPKMISREFFMEILAAIRQQDEINEKLGRAFEDYADSQYVIVIDSYHSALMKMMEYTFAFCETLPYWLYDGGKSFEADGIEVDISTVDKLYDCLCQEFIECGGQPLKTEKDKKSQKVSQKDLQKIIQKQLLGKKG